MEQFLTSYNNNLAGMIDLLVQSESHKNYMQLYMRDVFLASENEMANLNSEYKRIQNFQMSGTLVLPVEIPIGTRLDVVKKDLSNSTCSLQLVPIELVFERLLASDFVFEKILEYLKELNTPHESMTNIIHGSVWQGRNLVQTENEMHLPVILYYDDFEVNNPLGSHAGVQKLGGVYLSLPFLPPYWFSQLNNIIMLSVFHASDRRTFGNRAIFQPIINKLNYLSRTGVIVQNKLFQGVVKFHVISITGDNLGLNGILGFVESFIGNYCCRICSVEKKELAGMHTLNRTLLRNVESYNKDLKVNDPSKTGIREKCVWLELDGFSLFENVAVDILHDYFEGCCRYVLSFVVNYVIKVKKIVSFQVLQRKIFFFDYGPDSSSKPSNILLDDGTAKIKIKCSGSEMLVFVRYFGLIIGYYVPEDDSVWRLYVLLRKLLDKLMKRSFSKEEVAPLKHCIELFLWTYCDVVNDSLKPKFHFLLHYPDMYLRFGPLISLSTFRFEAKHRVSKIAARAACNRVNISKTVAMRNQLSLHKYLSSIPTFQPLIFGKKIDISPKDSDFLKSKFNISCADLFFSTKWIQIEGNKIEKCSILIKDVSLDTMLPIFVQVEEIFLCKDQVYLSYTTLKSLAFIDHYQAYEIVRQNHEIEYLSLKNFYSHTPHTLSIQANFTFYVTLRENIE